MTLCLISLSSYASVVISGTRVIYPSDNREVSVRINNNGAASVLLQSWIDDGDHHIRSAQMKVPFVITPPINRVDAGKGQTIRITYIGTNLPMDKESVFWLNVLEIPAKNASTPTENRLQVAFRSRIKLFFRPSSLQGNANDAVKLVNWRSKYGKIEAINPTPFYINLISIYANNKIVDGMMIPPKSNLLIDIGLRPKEVIQGRFVNDYGAIESFSGVVE